MAFTKREKSVIKNAVEKLWATKVAKTDQKVKSALRLMTREANLPDPVEEAEIEAEADALIDAADD